MNTPIVSNWAAATKEFVERDLECPKCHAMNRPGARVIAFDIIDGMAVCDACTYAFRPAAAGS